MELTRDDGRVPGRRADTGEGHAMTLTDTVRRPAAPAGRDGFGALLHAEWTKFRTVRWLVGIVVAILVTLAFGIVTAAGSHTTAGSADSGGKVRSRTAADVPTGPAGGPVTDGYFLLHRTLTGDGTITARITSMTGGVGTRSTRRLRRWAPTPCQVRSIPGPRPA